MLCQSVSSFHSLDWPSFQRWLVATLNFVTATPVGVNFVSASFSEMTDHNYSVYTSSHTNLLILWWFRWGRFRNLKRGERTRLQNRYVRMPRQESTDTSRLVGTYRFPCPSTSCWATIR